MQENSCSVGGSCVVLINPASMLKRPRDYECLLAEIEKRQLNWQIVIAENQGLADAARRAITKRAHRIFVYGGDGSVSEVAGVLAGSNIALGIIPSGTGNDFARLLGIPRDTKKALDLLENVEEKWIDLGQCNGRFFINVAGIGFDAEVLKNAKQFKKHARSRKIAYLLSVFYTLIQIRSHTATIYIDGERQPETMPLLLSVVGNGQYIGGGMCVAPQAKIDDGILDICLVRQMSRWRFLCLLPLFIKGKHIPKSDVIFYRKVKTLVIEFEQAQAVQIDGELFSSTRLEAKVAPQMLKCLIPRATAES